MAKLRDRKTKRKSSRTNEANVVCDCGEVFRTERTRRFDVIECDACGRDVFVLPRSPYPAVRVPEPDTESPKARPAPRARSSEAATGQNGGSPQLSLESRQRLITPVRLTVLAAIAIVAGTGYWLHRRSVTSEAERAFVVHSEAGDEALQRGDHAAARLEFEQAVEAAEILGRDDAPARHARQMLRECTAIADLSSETIFGLLTEAENPRMSPEDWKQTFRRDYRGKWLVLDTIVRGKEAEITYPLQINGQPVRLTGELSLWKTVAPPDGERRMILAVQLKACDKRDSGWVVELEPESAFLWSNFDNLRAVGFDVAPEIRANAPGEIDTATELRQLLDQQSRLLELEP